MSPFQIVRERIIELKNMIDQEKSNHVPSPKRIVSLESLLELNEYLLISLSQPSMATVPVQ